ncbi:phage tail protein [Limosilactobacillus agrestis]|uniref:phage tail protein n=1 Tax=Limosilactobacillus agrestis TaxID=2759748 RepID=UPI001E47EE4D|nr:phage tail protein [Limosilactobacillus agrestis]MCD7113426.1 phage tail protein [Limosilactobacillus agrestis]
MTKGKLYSDLLNLDLQRFAVDSTEGLVGTGTKLERSTDGTTWEEIADIKTVPELGGDTEKVDVTTLADDRRKQVEGIQNASNVQFQAIYKGSSFAKALKQAGDRKQYQWRVTYPDGMTATMRGSYNIKFASVAVNGALGYTITITVSDGPHFTAADGDSATDTHE